MTEEGQPRATVGARPSAADVQRFGLLSAAAVAARYAKAVDRAVGGWGPLGAETHAGRSVEEWVAEVTRDLMRSSLRLLDAGAALVERSRPPATPPPAELLELPATAPGQRTWTSLWVHNPTGRASSLTLYATPLVCGQGHVLPSESVVPDLPRALELPPGDSVEVHLHVTVPSGLPPGRYHGLLVGTAAPEPLRVVVPVVATAPCTPVLPPEDQKR